MTSEVKPETHKLMFETMKHLTTLSSGGALLVVTLAEKLFPTPDWGWLIVASVMCFLASLTASLFMMFQIAAEAEAWRENDKRAVQFVFPSTLAAFGLGVYAVAVFALKNAV